MKPTRLTSRPWPMAIGSGAALLLGALWCARTPAVEVEASTVHRAPLRVEVNTNGTVEPVPEAESRVHARLSGRIVELPEPGTVVKKGDVVLRIDQGPVSSALAAAESERLAAQEALRAARKRFELVRRRTETDRALFEKGAITRQRFGEAEATVAEARSQLENLEHEVPLRVASLDLRIQELTAQRDAAEVHAPFSGTIYRTDFREGETVQVGEPILWLANLQKLRVRANIDQVDLGKVNTGQPVRITSNAWPDRSWTATVTEIVPHVIQKDNRAVSESLALVQPPAEGLVPGMTVDVDIIVDEAPGVLQVPAAAVRAQNGQSYVFRVVSGRAERTPVTIGRASVTAVEVLGGLEPDDQVIVGSSNGLESGSPIEVRVRDVAAR